MSVSTPCQYAYVYIILTPHEYYTELPAHAINAVSNKPGLAHQLRTLHLLCNSIIESVDSINRDERGFPLTQYITNGGISSAKNTSTHFKHHHRVLRLISNRMSV